eukprot:SAG31_NODE_2579_length_5438_cov_17.092527_2_plen_151_part_00
MDSVDENAGLRNTSPNRSVTSVPYPCYIKRQYLQFQKLRQRHPGAASPAPCRILQLYCNKPGSECRRAAAAASHCTRTPSSRTALLQLITTRACCLADERRGRDSLRQAAGAPGGAVISAGEHLRLATRPVVWIAARCPFRDAPSLRLSP